MRAPAEGCVPVMNRIIVVIILLIVAFLAGFVPQYLKVKRLEQDLSVATRENALAQLRDLAGLAFVQASQKNYGLAAATSQQFFSRTREAASQTPDPNGRTAFDQLLASQDRITAELAKGDPEVLNDLQVLFEKTRQAAAGVGR